MKYLINTDGGSRGNPGPSASAFIIKDQDNNQVHEQGVFLGRQTNNHAEYTAVKLALEWLVKNVPSSSQLDFYLDSLLVVNQLKGIYQVKDSNLSQLNKQIHSLIFSASFTTTFTYVPRAQNSAADLLVNHTLDSLL